MCWLCGISSIELGSFIMESKDEELNFTKKRTKADMDGDDERSGGGSCATCSSRIQQKFGEIFYRWVCIFDIKLI